MHTCIHTYMCIHRYMYMHTYIHTYIQGSTIYKYIYTSIYIYTVIAKEQLRLHRIHFSVFKKKIRSGCRGGVHLADPHHPAVTRGHPRLPHGSGGDRNMCGGAESQNQRAGLQD